MQPYEDTVADFHYYAAQKLKTRGSFGCVNPDGAFETFLRKHKSYDHARRVKASVEVRNAIEIPPVLIVKEPSGGDGGKAKPAPGGAVAASDPSQIDRMVAGLLRHGREFFALKGSPKHETAKILERDHGYLLRWQLDRKTKLDGFRVIPPFFPGLTADVEAEAEASAAPAAPPLFQEAWSAVCARLERRLGVDTFRDWFGQMEFLGVREDVAVLRAPTENVRNYVVPHYGGELRELLARQIPEVAHLEIHPLPRSGAKMPGG